jgi:hypothetical protein
MRWCKAGWLALALAARRAWASVQAIIDADQADRHDPWVVRAPAPGVGMQRQAGV